MVFKLLFYINMKFQRTVFGHFFSRDSPIFLYNGRVATHTGKTGKYLNILGKNRYLIILEIFKIWVFFQYIEVLENDQKILEYTGFQFSR